jgi:hypothetical protein
MKCKCRDICRADKALPKQVQLQGLGTPLRRGSIQESHLAAMCFLHPCLADSQAIPTAVSSKVLKVPRTISSLHRQIKLPA